MKIKISVCVILAAALARPASAQEHASGFAALLGRPLNGAEYGVLAQPAAAGSPSVVTQNVRGGYVVARGAADEWTAGGRLGETALGRTPLVLPQNGVVVPTKLWTVQGDGGYTHKMGDRRAWGAGLGVGSASDRPFNSIHETDFSATARYELPSRERNSWILFLNYSNNRTFLNNVPLPGFAYVIRDPANGLLAAVGFPFAFVRWEADPLWTLSASVFGGSNWSLEAARKVWSPVSVYARLERRPEQWLRAGRATYTDRLIYDQKMARLGARAPLGAGFSLDGSAGWSFDRSFYEGRDASHAPSPRAALRNDAVMGLSVVWRP